MKKGLTIVIADLLKKEKGAALIVITLGLTVLLASVSLVTDVGLMYFHKIQVDNAADAAALAGVQALPDKEKAEETALEYAQKNGMADPEIIVSEDRKTITVTAARTFDMLFAKVLGIDQGSVRGRAKARLEPLTSARGVVPLGIPEHDLVFGETYILKSAASDSIEGDYHSAWMGILALSGPGARCYEDDLKYGFDREIALGDLVDIQTGNISGKTANGVQYRLDGCKHTPTCTFEHFVTGCPQVAIMPVVAPYSDRQVQVVGFAAFFLESVAGMGNKNYIMGKFIRYMAAGGSSATGTDYGLSTPVLTR